MDNMAFYNAGRSVPQTAQKPIAAGKIKGFTDINPMWRIQTLTELFGPCGIGWYTEVLRRWTEEGNDGKVAAFCEINLYIKVEGEWSKPIFGTGGSMFVNIFKGAPETSDECYKMAYTDAISVAAKALGIGADIYWKDGRTKYDRLPEGGASGEKPSETIVCNVCGNVLPEAIRTKSGDYSAKAFFEKYGGRCPTCVVAAQHAKKNAGDGA